jgi:colanic acid/amylovoran biosynthesis glycosyltransferase
VTPINVLHVKETFLLRSEKWFHYILEVPIPGKKWLAARLFQNVEEFPLKSTQLIRVPPEGRLTNLINRAGYRTLHRPLLWGTRVYAGAVLDLGHDVTHAHYGPMGHALCAGDSPLAAPVVTSFYGYDISLLPRDPYWQRAYSHLFRRGSGFIVEGGHMRKALLTAGCPPEKAFVVRIPVDPNVLPFKEQQPRGVKPVILMCCNFVEKKGVPWALNAFAAARKYLPHAELRIIGGGLLWNEVTALIDTLGLASSVTLLGNQPHGVFIQEAQRADLFMQPSIVAADGTTEGGAPTVLIEAQCMGLPVIASLHADIPEIVVDGQSGHLVAERNIDALASAICRAADEHVRWSEMGRCGREHVIRNHAPAAVAQQLHTVYEAVLAK